MKKTFRINEKRLAAKYNRRLFLSNLPSLSILISLMIIVGIFIAGLKTEFPSILSRAIFYAAYGSVIYSFIICLTGSIISGILINAHKHNTYIEISDSIMIISQHCQTLLREGKPVYYKKLWIVKLNEIEEVSCLRNRITITVKARFFNQKADWLGYECTSTGVSFDNWWYDNNGGSNVETIEIPDFYTYGERIAKRIAICSRKIKERDERRAAFRREMLEIAGKANRTKGIRDKYIQPKKRVFRP